MDLNHKVPSCILCGDGDVSVRAKIPFSVLSFLYKDGLHVDIASCTDRPYPFSDIFFYRCRRCALEFFPPELAGSAKLYEILGENEWYYGESKWEFDQAVLASANAESVLEIGCGRGHFLLRLHESHASQRLVGLELNDRAIQKGRQQGLDIRKQMIEEFAKDPANHHAFDFVCSFQVLEHIADPKSFIESALMCLKKGGLLFISVPNPNGFTKFVENDILNMPPHHIARFNKTVMQYLAKRYHLVLKMFHEEPIAEYHKGWYRTTLVKKALLSCIGLNPKLVVHSRSLRYKILSRLVYYLEKLIPNRVWRYKKYTGHTWCVILEKS